MNPIETRNSIQSLGIDSLFRFRAQDVLENLLYYYVPVLVILRLILRDLANLSFRRKDISKGNDKHSEFIPSDTRAGTAL